MSAADMMCFPWAIVEVKRIKNETSLVGNTEQSKDAVKFNKKSEQVCYCQAANASYSALTMREELVAKAG